MQPIKQRITVARFALKVMSAALLAVGVLGRRSARPYAVRSERATIRCSASRAVCQLGGQRGALLKKNYLRVAAAKNELKPFGRAVEGAAQPGSSDDEQEVRSLRWWLAEGLHTDETLRYEIDTAHRLGFGGMEFLAMDEGDIDHARYGWGAEEWVHDSQIVVEETTKRNMSVSFTSGTNWSNANLPTIDADHPAAAKELDVVSEDLAGGRLAQRAPCRGSTWPPSRRRAPPSRAPRRDPRAGAGRRRRRPRRRGDRGRRRPGRRLGRRPDRPGARRGAGLDRPGRRHAGGSSLLGARHRPDRVARPRRSTTPSTTSTRDGAQAVIDYWDTVVLTPELREQIAPNPRAQMYMDSLELSTYGAGGLFWGRTVAEEFRTRRGYDIAPWLPFLTRRRAVDGGLDTDLPPRAARRAPDHGREGPLRLRADADRPLHREHAASVRGLPARRTG